MEAEPGKPGPLEEAHRGAAATVLPDNPTAKPWQSPEPWVSGGRGREQDPLGLQPRLSEACLGQLVGSAYQMHSGPWGISQIYYR